LTIDNQTVRLGSDSLIVDGNLVVGSQLAVGRQTTTDQSSPTNQSSINQYISAAQKRNLKPVFRKPYFHFLVDVSNGKDSSIANYTQKIEKILAKNKDLAVDAKISFVNAYVQNDNIRGDWKQTLKAQKFEGGFYLNHAIKATLVNAYKESNATYPVMVVVTDKFGEAVLENDFSDMKMCFPDRNTFFEVLESGDLAVHSLTSNPKLAFGIAAFNGASVLEYKFGNKIAYLPNDNQQVLS
jgi:hypothetical protein